MTLLRTDSAWRAAAECPPDTAVLVYADFHYEVAHFNTALGAWVSCWDHRPLARVGGWQPLPAEPRP